MIGKRQVIRGLRQIQRISSALSTAAAASSRLDSGVWPSPKRFHSAIDLVLQVGLSCHNCSPLLSGWICKAKLRHEGLKPGSSHGLNIVPSQFAQIDRKS